MDNKHRIWSYLRFLLFIVFTIIIAYSVVWIYRDYRIVEEGRELSPSEKSYNIKGDYLYDKKVLVISSYTSTYSIVPEEEDGIYETLKAAKIGYEVDYMNMKELGSSAEHELAFYDSLKEHLDYHAANKTEFAAIMAGDDEALRFCMKYKSELFPNLPVVFYGVNDLDYARECATDPHVTGSIEKTYLKETIDLALQMIPNANEFIMIRDNTPTSSGDYSDLESLLPEYPGFTISDINTQEMSQTEFQEALGHLSDQAIVLCSIALKDNDNHVMPLLKLFNTVGEYANVPVFSCYMHAIGTGCVAGDAMFMRDCGETAAQMVVQILNYGVAPADLPLRAEGFHRIAVDQNQMNKFGLKLENIPENALVLNYTPGFWESYQAILKPLIMIILSLMGMMIVLFIDSILLRNARTSLQKSTQEAQEASEAKSVFLSTMSHDILTPITAIMGMTNLAKKNMPDTQKVSENLEQIDSASKHLLNMVSDVLDIAQINSKEYRLNPHSFSVKELSNSIHAIASQNAEKKGQKFVYSFENKTDKDWLMGDSERLGQIILNLLDNAVKFTPEGGFITSSLQVSDEGRDIGSVQISFDVQDNGIGMSGRFMDRMYDSFTTEEDGLASTMHGVGLGLAVAKANLEQFGGKIECESRKDHGTHFHVTVELPISAEGSDTEMHQNTMETLDGIHVLVAEDVELNWLIAQEYCDMLGIKSTWAKNGAECIRMLDEADSGEYDAILMDIAMPLVDGLEATKQIRASEKKYQNIPIVAMTADTMTASVLRCMEAGMNGFISKPSDMNTVRAEMLRVLNGRVRE